MKPKILKHYNYKERSRSWSKSWRWSWSWSGPWYKPWSYSWFKSWFKYVSWIESYTYPRPWSKQ